MGKRRMPAHIVLPNGMWRFVKSGAKKVSKAVRRVRSVRVKRRRHLSGAVSMVRRGRKRSSHRGFAGGGMSSLVKSALVGIGAAHLVGYVPIQVPYKEEVAGAIGAYMLGGKNIKTAAVGAGAVFLTKMVSSGAVSQATGISSVYF